MWWHYTYPKAYKKRSFGKWSLVIFCFIAAMIGGYVYIALSRDVPAGTIDIFQATNAQSQAADIAWPAQGHAAIGTLDAGVLTKSYNEEVPQPIASLAKVITALAVLEKAPMQPDDTGITITIDEADEASYWEYVNKQGTVTAVAAGEQLNQYQALQAMLLPSSNNMSDSLVRRVFGSMDSYKTYANEMVKRYGLKNTHIDDASGFSPRTVSTPSEMIVIGQKALEHPVIAAIVKQPNAEIPLSGIVPNYNGLLGVEGVNGIKPGVTDEAGWCLLFSATHQTGPDQKVTFIGVLLGEDNPSELVEASEKLLTIAKSNLNQVEVIRGGDVVGAYNTAWGETTELIAQESLWIHTIEGLIPKTVYKEAETKPLVPAKEPIGTIQLSKDTGKSIQVVTSKRVNPPSLLWRLKNPLNRLGLIK